MPFDLSKDTVMIQFSPTTAGTPTFDDIKKQLALADDEIDDQYGISSVRQINQNAEEVKNETLLVVVSLEAAERLEKQNPPGFIRKWSGTIRRAEWNQPVSFETKINSVQIEFNAAAAKTPTLAQVKKKFGLADEEIDDRFGVLPFTNFPLEKGKGMSYTVLVSLDAANRIEKQVPSVSIKKWRAVKRHEAERGSFLREDENKDRLAHGLDLTSALVSIVENAPAHERRHFSGGDLGGGGVIEYTNYTGDLDLITEFIKHGADPDSRDKHDGSTALILAAQHDKVEIGALLVKAGASLELENEGAATALTMAAVCGSTRFVRMLLDAGASVGEAIDGLTP